MISLIVATKGRITELDRLLTSLTRQSYRDFEIVIVDQNADKRLDPVLRQVVGLSLKHLRCSPGASRARNIGLRVASGEIVAFPDDDCWYPETLLRDISDWFQTNTEYGGLFAIMRGPDNKRVGPKSPYFPCDCEPATLFDCGATPNGFLRREVTDAIGFFDERIGLGAPTNYHSGEDVDYFVRALELGFRLRYDPQFTVHHPDWHNMDRVRPRVYGYALGGGFVMRVHPNLKVRFVRTVVRCFGGSLIRVFQGNWDWARAYFLSTVGLIRGFFFGPLELSHVKLDDEHADKHMDKSVSGTEIE
jgi:glycosyltransferase involved in cell wall biosynthesis